MEGSTNVSERPGGGAGLCEGIWSGRMWGIGRWVLLAFLILSFILLLLRIFPLSGSTSALVSDIKSGRTHSVQMDANGTQVTVRWRTRFFIEHSYEYHPAGFVPGAAEATEDFIATVKGEAGVSASAIDFRPFDSSFGAGGIGLLVPTAYIFLVPWLWLRIVTLIIGLLILCRMLSVQRHRLASGPSWALVAILTGVGFMGYLGAESSGRVPNDYPLRWWRAWGVTLLISVILAIVGTAALLSRRYL